MSKYKRLITGLDANKERVGGFDAIGVDYEIKHLMEGVA